MFGYRIGSGLRLVIERRDGPPIDYREQTPARLARSDVANIYV